MIHFSVYYSLKSPKTFPGAAPNLKTLLTRLTMSDDKLVSSFSQLLMSLALENKPGKQDNSFEIGQVSRRKTLLKELIVYAPKIMSF